MTTNNILIPMIRVLHPTVIAQQLVGVQPMTAASGQVFSIDTQFPYDSHPCYKFSRQWHIGKVSVYQSANLVHKWCEETFGPHPKNPDAWCRWYRYSIKRFYFRDEQDILMFKLKWE